MVPLFRAARFSTKSHFLDPRDPPQKLHWWWYTNQTSLAFLIESPTLLPTDLSVSTVPRRLEQTGFSVRNVFLTTCCRRHLPTAAVRSNGETPKHEGRLRENY